MTTPKKKVSKTIAKATGPIGQVLTAIPDTAEVINQTIESAAPIVEKELDHRREDKKNFADVPDVIELDLVTALEHVENAGFLVEDVLATPNQKYMDKRVGEVVDVSPKPSKPARIGSLVKVYYVDETVIEKSGDVTIPDVIGLDLQRARELVEAEGFSAVEKLAEPSAKHCSIVAGTVVDTSPKQTILKKTAKVGSTLYLVYVDDRVLELSHEIAQKREEKNAERTRAVIDGFGKARSFISRKTSKGDASEAPIGSEQDALQDSE